MRENFEDLIKGIIYNVDYGLMKEASESIYDMVLNNFNKLKEDLDSDSLVKLI